jgi:4-diphosphocytidyl-2-C-methyl-D-erythritol kinase
MVGFPHAKINLGLYLTAKRSDGYHELVSCFYPVAWEEALEIIPSSSFSFSSSGLDIPGDAASNLVVKAYELMQKKYQVPPSSIHLHKAIPMGAGLGGGSADAAEALIVLNQLYGLSLSKKELLELSAQLGSDCSFFIYNTPCIATSRGEKLAPIELSLKGFKLLLVHPSIHISTQQAYAGVSPKPITIDLKEVLKGLPSSWKEKLYNQFEEHLFVQFPEVAQIKEKLYASGAEYASMSGSGSAVFGIFKEGTDVEKIEWPERYRIKVVSC